MTGTLADNWPQKPGTMATAIFDRIRTDILEGRFKPEEKLRVEALKDIYQVGSTPIREALNRLTAEGLVRQQDQRGFQVAPMSLDDLDDLTQARCLMYEIAMRESIARGDLRWEEEVLVAFHRLSRISEFLGESGGQPNPEWSRTHRAFHRALVSACGSNRLLEIIDTLFDMADRYRMFSVFAEKPDDGQAATVKRDFQAEHAALKDAVLARDTESAVRLIKEHVGQTAALAKLQASRLQAQGDGRKRG